jgi:hypothetical protein
MWLVIAGPALAGTITFFSGLMDHLGRDGAIEEFARRGRSRRLTGEARHRLRQAGVTEVQGNVQQAQQLRREALSYCEGALASDAWRQNRPAMLLQGRIWVEAGDRRAEDYLKALAGFSDPAMPGALLELASLYASDGRTREAAETLVRFAGAVGEDAFNYCRAAKYAARAGDRGSADQLLERARAAQAFDDPESADFDHVLVLARAGVRAQQKRGKDVVEDLKRSLQPYSRDPAEFFEMGRQILQLAGSRQFQPVHDDEEFRDFIKWLQGRLQEILQRMRGGAQRTPGAPGGGGGGAPGGGGGGGE